MHGVVSKSMCSTWLGLTVLILISLSFNFTQNSRLDLAKIRLISTPCKKKLGIILIIMSCRYCAEEDAEPLWAASTGSLTCDDIPLCIYCKGQLRYEFQVGQVSISMNYSSSLFSVKKRLVDMCHMTLVFMWRMCYSKHIITVFGLKPGNMAILSKLQGYI